MTYTTDTLAVWMRDNVLGATASVVGLTALSQFNAAITAIADALGVPAIEDAANGVAVRALARREAWRLAMQAATVFYNTTEPNTSQSRAQVYDHCAAQYEIATTDAARYSVAPATPTRTGPAWSGAVPTKAVW